MSGQGGGERTLFERVGGGAFFVELVDRFYDRVEGDSLLRPVYPDELEPGKTYLAAFLAQYWGGPALYSLERGHPRLRQRHLRFGIGRAERDAWVGHMLAALGSMGVSGEDEREMGEYFERAATMMINRGEG